MRGVGLAVVVVVRGAARCGAVRRGAAAFDEGMVVSYADRAAMAELFLAEYRVNVLANVHAALAALPHLERSSGHIAITSSGSAKLAAPFHPGYVASKAAIHGLFDTFRAELKLIGRCGSYQATMPPAPRKRSLPPARSLTPVLPSTRCVVLDPAAG